jgi:O-antigen ligase
MAFLALMPLGMAVAHRSSPLFLGLSAALAVAALLAERRLGPFIRDVGSAARSPLGVAAGAFLGWSLLSALWSPFPALSLDALGEFALPILFGVVLAYALPERLKGQAFWLLAGSICLAQLLMLLDMRSGLELRQALGMRFDRYIFNRPSLTVLLLMPAVFAWLMRRTDGGVFLASCLGLLMALAVANSDSGAGALGLAFGGVVLIGGWFAPRLVTRLAAGGIVLSLALAPFFGPGANALFSDSVHKAFSANHSRARVDIWTGFDLAIRHNPIIGTGFGVSPRMGETEAAAMVSEPLRTLLAVGHPHNALIQIWVELGLVGAALAGIVVLLTLYRIHLMARFQTALSLSLIAAIYAVIMVGHGAWQGWWAAAIAAALIWLRAAFAPQKDNFHE